MSKDWIIEVLGDLRAFASMNELPHLAAQLEEAVVVALAEVAQADPAPVRAEAHDAEAGRLAREAR